MKTPETTTIIATPTGTGTGTTDSKQTKKEKPDHGSLNTREQEEKRAREQQQNSGNVTEPRKETAPMSGPQTGSDEKKPNGVVPPAGNETKHVPQPNSGTTQTTFKSGHAHNTSFFRLESLTDDKNEDAVVLHVEPETKSLPETKASPIEDGDGNFHDNEYETHSTKLARGICYQETKNCLGFTSKNAANLIFSSLQSWPYVFFGGIRGLERLGIKDPVFFASHDGKEIGMMCLYGGTSFVFNFVINYQSNQKLKDRIIEKLDKIRHSKNSGAEALKLFFALVFASTATLPGFALGTESFDDFTLLKEDWMKNTANGIFCSSVLVTRTLGWLDLFDALDPAKFSALIASRSTLNWLWLGTAAALFIAPIAYPFYFKSLQGAEEIEKFRILNMVLATISTTGSEVFYIKHIALLPDRISAYIDNNRFGKCLGGTAAFALFLLCFPSGATWAVAAGAAFTFVTNLKTLFYLVNGSQLAAGLVNWSIFLDQFSWKLPTPTEADDEAGDEMHNPTGPDQPRSLPPTPQTNPRLSTTSKDAASSSSKSKSSSWGFGSRFFSASNDEKSTNKEKLLPIPPTYDEKAHKEFNEDKGEDRSCMSRLWKYCGYGSS